MSGGIRRRAEVGEDWPVAVKALAVVALVVICVVAMVVFSLVMRGKVTSPAPMVTDLQLPMVSNS